MAKFDLDAVKKLSGDNTNRAKISVRDMIPNKFNEYSCEDLEILAEDIDEHGLMQNFVLMEGSKDSHDGKYMIIAGHRRYYAINKLIEWGKKSEKDTWDCKIIPYSDDELDIQLSLVIANNYRAKNDAEKLFEYRVRKKAMERDLAKGIKVSGRKRAFIADAMGISTGKVSEMEMIEKYATESVKKKVEDGELSIKIAKEVSKLPAKEQDELARKTESEVKVFIEQKNVSGAVKTDENNHDSLPQDTEFSTDSAGEGSEKKTKPDKRKSDNKNNNLTADDFIKCVKMVINSKSKILSAETKAEMNGVVEALEDLLSKDIKTILDSIS